MNIVCWSYDDAAEFTVTARTDTNNETTTVCIGKRPREARPIFKATLTAENGPALSNARASELVRLKSIEISGLDARCRLDARSAAQE